MRIILSALWALIGIVVFSGCVPQKKILILQDNPQVENQGKADELLRTFELKPEAYTLKPGDVLSLRVQSTTPAEFDFLASGTTVFGGQDPVLNGYTLDANGNILIPAVGKVELSGLTMPEARIKVTEALNPYLTNPTVNLRLLTFRYTIIGEVPNQGQFTTYQDNINVMEAIASAGGFSPYSNRSNIKLVRYDNGVAKLYEFSLLDDNMLAQGNYYLQPNDMIVVDPLPAKYIRENLLTNVTLGISLLSTISFLVIRFLQ
ncbi:polysaccharide biosynthesis/export family protein [Pontibacter toksunensis]|uniref:Polysaccharide biosynthesis/export family protein n=1 Tax=Pontibacter toksunensis TaxID=1332631 RepID=A0ABW6BPU2_9BACT